MDLIANLWLGFGGAVTPANLIYCLLGAIIGTAIGVLPGLGPVTTIAILLPVTFGMEPLSALIMLAGIYYGAQYGGSTTAILLRVPGENSSVITALDGYEMARRGRAGPALVTAAVGSFIAGSIATLVIALFAPILAMLALRFGPAEYFSLMLLGLVSSIVLASGAITQALAMLALGLLLGVVGTDMVSGVQRFTFNMYELSDGIDFIIIAMGLFGLADVIANARSPEHTERQAVKVGKLMLTRDDWRRIRFPILRGTFIGSLLGLLPGGGAMLSSIASYAVEKKISRSPEEFGKGMIEGLAGPESANNAGAQTSFIPMLTLGIPSNPVMALMIGALVLQGVQPGPTVMTEQPILFWGVIASMWIGNLMLLVLNLPLVGLWVKLVSFPYKYIMTAILIFCVIGTYSLRNSVFDVYLLAGFTVFGYVVLRLGAEPAPLLLGFILGPMFEEFLQRALLLSDGDPMVFVTRPLSAVMLLFAAIILVSAVMPRIRKQREIVFSEDA